MSSHFPVYARVYVTSAQTIYDADDSRSFAYDRSLISTDTDSDAQVLVLMKGERIDALTCNK